MRLMSLSGATCMLMLGLSVQVKAGEVKSDLKGGRELLTIGSCHMTPSYFTDFSTFTVTPWKVKNGSWIAHTPWAGDFGDAAFADPSPKFPFTTERGGLRIEARKIAGRWRSGLIASADGDGNGFGQKYGYFEVGAKLPAGRGLWPAIWLASIKPKGVAETSVEIDIIEHYGHAPGDFHSVLHVWGSKGESLRGDEFVSKVEPGSLYASFHRYGVDVEPEWITFYFDRREYWRAKTPANHQRPLMILIDLALGSGWPIDQAPNPSVFQVSSIAVWRGPDRECDAH